MLNPLLRAWLLGAIVHFVVIGLAIQYSATAAAAEHPNVVVILADDQGWGDLSIHGNTNLATPNIDSLAHDGALFEHFYVCPVCSPTRAEFLTGRYHVRGGVFSTSTGGERLDLDETTIGETFQKAGYATGAFGKWHNGTQYPYHPNARGFGEYYGFCSGHWGHYFNPILEHNGKTVRGTGFIADDLTDHALAFIDGHRDEPFFCYLPFNTPHSPMQVPDRFYEKFAEADLKMRHDGRQEEDLAMTRAALAMCENIDWNVGRVLEKLDQLKLADNTIVLYFSDNGPNSWRWNDGMKGRKGSTDEGGVRSPLVIRWPGHIKPGLRSRADCRRDRLAADAGRAGERCCDRPEAAGRREPHTVAVEHRRQLAQTNDLLALEREGQPAHTAIPPRQCRQVVRHGRRSGPAQGRERTTSPSDRGARPSHGRLEARRPFGTDTR